MTNSPFSPWWYYEMGREAEKSKSSDSSKPKQSAGLGLLNFFMKLLFFISLIIAILSFIGFVAICIWYFF